MGALRAPRRHLRQAARRRLLPLLLSAGCAASLACGSRSQLFTNDSIAVDAGAPPLSTTCVKPRPSDKLAPAYIEIVLDGSGSMADSGKWQGASIALGALFDEYLAAGDDSVAMGLLVFSDYDDPTGGQGPYPSSIDVPPAFVDRAQYDALRGRIAKTRPVGPTPTYEALSGAFQMLHAYVVPPRLRSPGRRVAVLVSDGAPTAATAAGEVDVEKARTVKLVAEQRAVPPAITTFAIGIGQFPPQAWYDYDPEFMGNIAIAGGTRATPKCDPLSEDVLNVCHIQVTPDGRRTPADLASDLLRALHDVRTRTTDLCAFVLEGELAKFDPDRTMVSVVQTPGAAPLDVPRDDASGWSFQPPSTLELHGSSCDAVVDRANAEVVVVPGCRS